MHSEPTAVGPHPWRMPTSEHVLVAQRPTECTLILTSSTVRSLVGERSALRSTAQSVASRNTHFCLSDDSLPRRCRRDRPSHLYSALATS